MTLLDGYIMQRELVKRAGVSASLFYQLNGIVHEKIGFLSAILVTSLPEKYRSAAEQCIDLGTSYPVTAFSLQIGATSSYLSCLIKCRRRDELIAHIERPFPGMAYLRLSREFIDLVRSGMTPFLLTGENKTDAERIISMYGIHIGFY
jgi:hypothetical protein